MALVLHVARDPDLECELDVKGLWKAVPYISPQTKRSESRR